MSIIPDPKTLDELDLCESALGERMLGRCMNSYDVHGYSPLRLTRLELNGMPKVFPL